jgi:ribosomal subunit interface protein
MEHPVQVTFRGIESTDAIKKAVEDRARDLERYYDKIQSCKVMVESSHRSQRQGNLYHVRVRLAVPGEEIVISRDPPEHAQNEDMYLVVNEAFQSAARRLEDYVRRRRRQVKQNVAPPRGRVIRIFPEEGYGFLEDAEGRELYFHRNSVLDDGFPRLKIGSEVRFAEEAGEKGPQASSVSLAGR